jgi:hypothetical protein
MQKKSDYLKKRIEEFNRLYEITKKIPNMTPELLKGFYERGMNDLYEGELENQTSELVIKETKKSINETVISFEESGLLSSLNKDCAKVLQYYRNEITSGKRKTCFFQENILQEVLRVNNLFCFRISHFSNMVLKTFNRNAYAGLILLRSNIENLLLYYFYNDQLEKLFHNEKWLDIAKLNARILYSKKKEVETRFENLHEMDYLDFVNNLVTMHGAKEKPIHISDCINYYFNDQKKEKNVNLSRSFDTPLLKKYAQENKKIRFVLKLEYYKEFYDQLCEVVHPVAIYRKSYPFDKDDPNVKIKFAASFGVMPYVSTLYIKGIGIYEKIRSIDYKKINIIEKNLYEVFQNITDKSSIKYVDEILKNKNYSNLTKAQKEFIIKAKNNLAKQKIN